MTEDRFLERLREEAETLRFEPDGVMVSRIAARVRERVTAEAQAGISQILSRWFRPVVTTLAALAVAAVLGIGWLEEPRDPSPASTLDTMTGTQTVDISVGGDTFSVE